MLVKPPLEKVLSKVDNRYTLAILVAKRARQLVDGAQPMVNASSPNLVTVASEELAANQIVGVKGIVEPVVPLRPDVEMARLAARNAAAQASMADAVREALDQAADMDDDFDDADMEILTENLMSGEAVAEEDEDVDMGIVDSEEEDL